MLYRKNIYSWEQLLRIVGGIGLAAYAFFALNGSLLGYTSIASGIFLAITGVVGWCPVCAIGGRKIKADASR